MMRRLSGGAFWVLLAALVIANAVLCWQSLTTFRLWEDEAFNLTVPRNLLAGLGYTSDGALSGSTLTPFDPRISTGASVLLPVALVLATGIDPVIGARLIPLLYWGLLLAGLWILGRRIAGRWGALVAIAVPLAFQTAASNSPIQGPADLLGEIPAAALLVWAFIVLPRRAWLAGLLFGLALQAKLIALIALPAFAVALWALTPGRGWKRIGATATRSILPLVLAGLPTLLMEIAAFVILGRAAYLTHLRELASFVRSSGQNVAPTTIPEKVTVLADSWFSSPWLVLAAVLLGLAVGAVACTRSWRTWRTTGAKPAAEDLALGLAAVVGFLAFVGWWAQAAHTPLWVRHPAPGVFAFAPLLAAFTVRGMQFLWKGSLPLRALSAATATALIAVLGIGAAAHTVNALNPGWETLHTQRAAAAPLAAWVDDYRVTWLAAAPWGAAVPIIVLTGAHVGMFDAPAMQGVPQVTGGECSNEVLADSGTYRICQP
ncbi:hypothetical protein ACFU0W_15010 [Microbacterium keratanolyticum]|uniref:hypothetical protein n=1 Tax=Microbacterium keratanolyticum TaxID=67574 RepID=UPI0036272E51